MRTNNEGGAVPTQRPSPLVPIARWSNAISPEAQAQLAERSRAQEKGERETAMLQAVSRELVAFFAGDESRLAKILIDEKGGGFPFTLAAFIQKSEKHYPWELERPYSLVRVVLAQDKFGIVFQEIELLSSEELDKEENHRLYHVTPLREKNGTWYPFKEKELVSFLKALDKLSSKRETSWDTRWNDKEKPFRKPLSHWDAIFAQARDNTEVFRGSTFFGTLIGVINGLCDDVD